ncbi:MAG: NAD-dependent epimerase/dehydratase family protein [Candidatus Paceibacterota bacterium]
MSYRILITGASGFIGQHLLDKLINNDNNAIACINRSFDSNFKLKYGSRVKIYEGNILDLDFINDSIQNFKPHHVFHLAASKSRTNELIEFRNSFDVNYFGTLNLLQSLKNLNELELITLIGTIEEYGMAEGIFNEKTTEYPVSAYGLSKLSATKLAILFSKQYNVPSLVIRPSIAYGPRQGNEMFMPSLINSLLKKNRFLMTPGAQHRDFIYIEDLVNALSCCIGKSEYSGKIINIAAGKSERLIEVAKKIAKSLGAESYLEVGALPYRKSEIMAYHVDIELANEILNWSPKIGLDEGLDKTIKHYKEINL